MVPISVERTTIKVVDRQSCYVSLEVDTRTSESV